MVEVERYPHRNANCSFCRRSVIMAASYHRNKVTQSLLNNQNETSYNIIFAAASFVAAVANSVFLRYPKPHYQLQVVDTPALDTETLVDAIEKADCNAATTTLPPAKTKKSSNDDVIVNGTAKRVQQNPLGKFADAVSSAFFSVLHYDDKLEIKDSSKNLRVLWSRAFLNHVGSLDDDIAYQLCRPAHVISSRFYPRVVHS